MDRLMELSEYMVKKIQEQPDKFQLLFEPEMVNVSFWYIPSRLRSVPQGRDREQELGKVSRRHQSHSEIRLGLLRVEI